MSDEVPGLYDPATGRVRELTQFAVEHGLDERSLDLLTDPPTRVVVTGKDGRKHLVPLGCALQGPPRLVGVYLGGSTLEKLI